MSGALAVETLIYSLIFLKPAICGPAWEFNTIMIHTGRLRIHDVSAIIQGLGFKFIKKAIII